MSSTSSTFVKDGQSVGGKMTGGFTLRMSNGDSFEGILVDGLPEGYGIRRRVNGEFQKGEFRNRTLWNGRVRWQYSSGLVSGLIKDGRIWEGIGQVQDDDGTKTGNFRAGELWGHGKWVTKEGRLSKGLFENGILKSGVGWMDWKGHLYHGGIAEFVPHGAGRLMDLQGCHVGRGQFRWGVLQTLDKDTMLVPGNGFRSQKRGGMLEVGELEDQTLNGWGARSNLTDRIEVGRFQDGLLTFGKVITPFQVDEGFFKLGKLHGQGKRMFLPCFQANGRLSGQPLQDTALLFLRAGSAEAIRHLVPTLQFEAVDVREGEFDLGKFLTSSQRCQVVASLDDLFVDQPKSDVAPPPPSPPSPLNLPPKTSDSSTRSYVEIPGSPESLQPQESQESVPSPVSEAVLHEPPTQAPLKINSLKSQYLSYIADSMLCEWAPDTESFSDWVRALGPVTRRNLGLGVSEVGIFRDDRLFAGKICIRFSDEAKIKIHFAAFTATGTVVFSNPHYTLRAKFMHGKVVKVMKLKIEGQEVPDARVLTYDSVTEGTFVCFSGNVFQGTFHRGHEWFHGKCWDKFGVFRSGKFNKLVLVSGCLKFQGFHLYFADNKITGALDSRGKELARQTSSTNGRRSVWTDSVLVDGTFVNGTLVGKGLMISAEKITRAFFLEDGTSFEYEVLYLSKSIHREIDSSQKVLKILKVEQELRFLLVEPHGHFTKGFWQDGSMRLEGNFKGSKIHGRFVLKTPCYQLSGWSKTGKPVSVSPGGSCLGISVSGSDGSGLKVGDFTLEADWTLRGQPESGKEKTKVMPDGRFIEGGEQDSEASRTYLIGKPFENGMLAREEMSLWGSGNREWLDGTSEKGHFIFGVLSN